MPKFKDRTGNEWSFETSVGTLRRVGEIVKTEDGKPFQLMSLIEDPANALGIALEDPVLLGDLMFALVGPQAKERRVTREAFLDLLDGASLVGGIRAAVEAAIAMLATKELRSALAWIPDAIADRVVAAEIEHAKTVKPVTAEELAELVGARSIGTLAAPAAAPTAA